MHMQRILSNVRLCSSLAASFCGFRVAALCAKVCQALLEGVCFGGTGPVRELSVRDL